MAKINLLPWREEYRQEKKKEFLGVIGFVLIAALFSVFLWDRWVNYEITNQNSRNQLLNSEIAQLNKKVAEIAKLKQRKQQLLDRMAVIQSLQGNRPNIVRVFDELAKTIPEGVYIHELKSVGNSISLVGYAESNNRVSAFMRAVDASYKFQDPNLTKVEADSRLGEQGNKFQLRFTVSKQPEVAATESSTAEGA